ncbi:MAG: serine hydrolase [Gammaproteobacteria bacterium]|jgi:CubicO group peptidase (beta-lactamase class C family)|nr:serine hydrolase [Gammaproteobacteria bacterium]
MHLFKNRAFFVLLVVALGVFGETATATPDDEAARVDALFTHFDEGIQPGAAVLVIKDGEVVFQRGYGYADLKNKVRIDANSSFRLGSVSKQFTTMAVAVLAEEGELEYDDLLIEHIPELGSWPGVTIRHLMHHTSGIPDHYEKGYYENFDPQAPMPQMSDLVDIMTLYPDPDAAPGDEFVYNNAAYGLLAVVVRRVTGMPFSTFLAERVFAPAGMTTATTFNSSRPDIPDRVYGYSKTEDNYELDDYDPFNDLLGDGGVYATLKDFVAWDASLYSNTVVSEKTLRQIYTSGQLNNGESTGYGFGWRVGAFRGHQMFAHSGSWVGFRTAIARYPDDNLAIVVLTNRADGGPSVYAEKIADIYLPGRGNTFVPDESQPSVMEHHRKFPTDDHWWNVRGKEQGWLHRHVDQLFPSTTVYRNGPVSELEYDLMDEVDDVQIDTPDGPIPFRSFIESDHSTAMGVVILHKGKIVFESYPRMQEYEKPTYWSTTKVMAGAVVRLLEERGLIDVSKPIDFYIPALVDSVHAGTTVRNVLDMATGVDCTENYEDFDSCYYQYSMAIGDNLRTPDAPDNPYDYMAEVQIERTRPQGEKFVYSGGTNFLLMWLVEEVTGYPYQDAITKEFWYHIGAENDAGFIAYRYGISMSHGGFHSKMRDLARFGLLYTPSYAVVSNKKIITDEHLDVLFNQGNPKLLRTGNDGGDEGDHISQNTYAWGVGNESGYLSHGGWGGQGLIIHPEKDVVAVFTSYTKDDYSEVSLQRAMFKVLDEVFVNPE